MTAALIARLRAQREAWRPLADFEVKLIRPLDVELDDFRVATRLAPLQAVAKYTADWRGATEASFLTAAVGSSDEVKFDRGLLVEFLGDRAEDISRLYAELLGMLNERHGREADAAKNSLPDSTTA